MSKNKHTGETQDYNRIVDWLVPLLEQKKMSVEQLARATHIPRASIYFWCRDVNRPSEQSMIAVCRALGRPVEEGLRQYTPRRNGRPRERDDSAVRRAR